MGVFKKLTGGDVRVTPIQVKYKKDFSVTVKGGTNKNSSPSNRSDFTSGSGIDNTALLYNSIRQLYYGPFISQNFISSGSTFQTPILGAITSESSGIFSRFDPSFQGSLPYQRFLPITESGTISVGSIAVEEFGESIVPGSVSWSIYVDDKNGNIIKTTTGVHNGNIFYDQGIIVLTDGTPVAAEIQASGSYTIYSTQYKCTAEPYEFNYTLNPTSLSGSAVDYDPSLVNSIEFMPYVTTIGLYNEDQELMMVGKLSQAVKLNPYTNTNFIVRIDR